MVFSALSLIIICTGILMACNDTSASGSARACYIVDGQRNRFQFVDETAQKFAKERGQSIAGDAASRAIRSINGSGILVLTSPFGSHVSLISLHGDEDASLNALLHTLLAELQESGFHVKPCEEIKGLENPVIFEEGQK